MNSAAGRRSSTGGRAVPDELLERAVAGDRPAADEVIATVRPVIERYCRARLGRHDETGIVVEDVVQETCLAVLTALPRYRGAGDRFLAFVYGTASQKVLDATRAATRTAWRPVVQVPDRADAVDESTLAGRLSHLLGTLPAHLREILVLRIAAGLSAEETAKAVGTTPGAVRVAQHRALARLRMTATEDGAASPDVVELLAELDEEPLRRSYTAYTEALAAVLDLDTGLTHLEDRGRHRDFVAGLAGQLNLDAGLDVLMRSAEDDG